MNLVRPCWISKLEPLNGMWHLSENGTPRGQFDVIVIAHNGNKRIGISFPSFGWFVTSSFFIQVHFLFR